MVIGIILHVVNICDLKGVGKKGATAKSRVSLWPPAFILFYFIFHAFKTLFIQSGWQCLDDIFFSHFRTTQIGDLIRKMLLSHLRECYYKWSGIPF